MKTIATTVIVALILGTAFYSNPTSATNEIDETTLTKVNQPEVSIHESVIRGDLKAVKQYIKAGKDLNVKEAMGGSSALTTAAVFGKTEIALALIQAGADVNIINNEGSTPLHTAAFFCRTEIVKALLAKGADKNLKNNAGSTALESVLAPYTAVQGIYEYFNKVYESMGLKLDFDQIKATRPVIAEMLK